MAQVRKTRQQKIQHSLRVREHETSHSSLDSLPQQSTIAAATTADAEPLTDFGKTQLYVIEELRRIGWISLLCGSLLLLATVLLSDFGWAVAVREWLNL